MSRRATPGDPRGIGRRLLQGPWPIVLVGVLVLVSLALLSGATHDSARFGEIYSLLLAFNLLALLTLALLIGWNLVRLLGQVRRGLPGARLTARMVALLVLLAAPPLLVVYYFSVQFLHRGIDSWFDVRVERTLEDALELSRAALGERMREQLKQTEVIAADLSLVPADRFAATVEEARRRSGATELTVLGPKGAVLASANVDPTVIVPDRPSDTILLQLRQSGSYIGLDPVGDAGLHIRVVVRLASDVSSGEPRVLQALFPVSERMNILADKVQAAYARYRELNYLRRPLKASFTLTLSLILLLSLFTAVWVAFYSARRVVAPLRDLAEGTRAVAEGDFETRLPSSGRDEVGFLVDSFNRMTERLAAARDETRRSQAQLERQRAYLETVLGRLSTGVLTLDHGLRLVTANGAAGEILGVELDARIGASLAELAAAQPHLQPLREPIEAHAAGHDEWREEVRLMGPRGRQVLTCSGAPLPGAGGAPAGHVVVFDDVTTLVDAQRNAAWSEVARRLAHEIKNPLTPIQLAAERLRHKYLAELGERGDLFDRLTRTIVQHVQAMQEMVNAFSEYARGPRMRHEQVDLNGLARDVAELYRGSHPGARIETDLDPALPAIAADPDRLRQVLHNLIKNALEAAPGRETAIRVETACAGEGARRRVRLQVRDSGPGFDPEVLERIFEPYVTSKARGTGLGLAIVRKIVEEHGGRVSARNENGACVLIELPAGAVPAAGRGARQREGASA